MSERLQQYDTYMLDVQQIYVDPDFNCREPFTLESVAELAESIKTHGLQFPIIVQVWEGTKYRLVAGHRRFAAMTAYLKYTEVPATIRSLSDFEAHKLNLIENLDRKDLNLLEEAKAIVRLYPAHSVAEVSKLVGRTEWWVRVRHRLLDQPDEVQQMAAAGLLKTADIDMLARLNSKSEQLAVAKEVAEQRKHDPKRRPNIKGTQYSAKIKHVPRTQERMNQMIRHLLESGISGLPPRLAAWCAGFVTTEDLEVDIQEYLKNHKTS